LKKTTGVNRHGDRAPEWACQKAHPEVSPRKRLHENIDGPGSADFHKKQMVDHVFEIRAEREALRQFRRQKE
jgi:hypothetical protein